MFLSLTIFFLVILNMLGYLPIIMTPILTANGRTLDSSRGIPLSTVEYWWDVSMVRGINYFLAFSFDGWRSYYHAFFASTQAIATMSPKVCFQELVCEIDRARKKWLALENTWDFDLWYPFSPDFSDRQPLTIFSLTFLIHLPIIANYYYDCH